MPDGKEGRMLLPTCFNTKEYEFKKKFCLKKRFVNEYFLCHTNKCYKASYLWFSTYYQKLVWSWQDRQEKYLNKNLLLITLTLLYSYLVGFLDQNGNWTLFYKFWIPLWGKGDCTCWKLGFGLQRTMNNITLREDWFHVNNLI